MSNPLTFRHPRLMRWGTNAITDHNRQSLQEEANRIENSERMGNGTLRKQVIAVKRTFSTSWDHVPATSAHTVDGFWGAKDMRSFYYSTPGSFTLELTFGDGTVETYTVMVKDFTANIVSRGSTTDLWNVSITLEEV